MRIRIDQESALPTRKVTAATIGAAFGGALGRAATELSAVSPWLSWLDVPDVQTLIYLTGSAAGALWAGYMVRDTIEGPRR